jgi:hypothetical protein
MNKKSTRSSEWYLLPKEAVKDKKLTTSDKNVLSVLIYLSKAFKTSFFRSRDKLIEDLKDSNVELSSKQVSRCICKLKELGYIDYVAGFHNNKEGFGKVSEFTLTYNTDNQSKCQNNVHPNTNTNTNPNTNTNTKPNTNNSTIEQNLNKEKVHSNTSVISTYTDELELVNPTLYTLLIDDDDIEVLNYIKENYTKENIEYIRSWWRNDDNKLQSLDNFLKNF